MREIYRVSVGVLPRAIHISSKEDLEYAIRDLSVGGCICVLDLDSLHNLSDSLVRSLADRLKELYSQGLGFLVLYGSRGMLESFRKELERRGMWGSRGVVWKPITLSIDRGSLGILNMLARIMFGRIYGASEAPEDPLDPIAVQLEDEFYRELEDIAKHPDLFLRVKPGPSKDIEGGESFTHYAYKVLAVYAVAREIEDIGKIAFEEGRRAGQPPN